MRIFIKKHIASLGFLLSVCYVFSQNGAASQKLSGNVIDEQGTAVPHASVQVLHASAGTTTDNYGSFSINAKIGDTLHVTSVGFEATFFPVTGFGQTTIVLKSSENRALDDVVVIGYGTQKKSNIIGAQSTFDAKNIEERTVSRVEQALIGQLPGVQVRQQQTLPGAPLSIVVRGTGSLAAGTEPLYVIDGFPLDVVSQSANGSFTNSPLSNLSPNDIESIEVLKDAAAGAIYGSRAANGVVLITTKRGKQGALKLNLNATAGISSVARKLDLLNAEEWVQVASAIIDSNWVNSKAGRTADQTQAERVAILGTLNPTLVKDDRWSQPGHPGLQYVDWQDVLFRKALFQNYSLNASGATEFVKYFISGNYLNQEGTVITSYNRNYSLRANVEANIGKKLTLGINLAPSYSEANLPSAEGKDNVIMNAAQLTPIVEESAGLLSGTFGNSTYKWSSERLSSPCAYLNNSYRINKTNRTLGTIYAEYKLLPELTLRSTFNYDGFNRTLKTYVSDNVVYAGQATLVSQPGLNSSGSYGGVTKQSIVNENTVNYTRDFKGGHSLSVLLGESYNQVHTENFGISTLGGFANNIVETLNNAIVSASGETFSASTTEYNTALLSFYGRAQYNYRSKYLLFATFRKDASSRFGANNRWGTFPSLSLGWRISQEDFFKNAIGFINDFKIRASWGRSGNNSIGDYNTFSLLGTSYYNFGGNNPTILTGAVPANIANPDLKWETSNTYDLGFDLSLLKNRLSVTFDVYEKRSSDLLMNLPVLAASGFTSALQNVGSVKARGVELGINSVNIRTSDFQWTSNFNIAFNSNKVTSLGPNQNSIEISSAYSGSNSPYLLQVGSPMYSFYVTKVAGILTQEDIDNPDVAKTSGSKVGDIKYYDRNNDGKITADDRVVYGHPNPDFTWGFSNTFSYLGFELNINAYGQHGGSILSYLGRAIDFSGSNAANVVGSWRDRWTAENQNYDATRGRLASTASVPHVTSNWVYSSDFWRIQNITLRYNFNRIINEGLLKNAKVYLGLENYFGKDKYYGGANPEAQNTNNSGNSSYAVPGDYGSLPINKTISLGFELTF